MTTPTMHLDCDGFAEALADYLEGDASESVRSGVETHAASCAACTQLLADLRAISTHAAALPILTPSRDLWGGIAERIDARVIPFDAPVAAPRTARRTWLRPALAAAALVGVTAGITHYVTRAALARQAVVHVAAAVSQQVAPTSTPTPAAVPVAKQAEPAVLATRTVPRAPHTSSTAERRVAQSSPRHVAPPLNRHKSSYGDRGGNSSLRLASTAPGADVADPVFNSEITKLRRIVRERRSQLDPKTVAVLEQSIAVMDSAIAQSRAALVKDPASGFLATQLNHSLEKKVELLRTAALLPART